MEIEDTNASGKQVLLGKEEFSEMEKREAFKKKLRKYSNRSNPGHLEEES